MNSMRIISLFFFLVMYQTLANKKEIHLIFKNTFLFMPNNTFFFLLEDSRHTHILLRILVKALNFGSYSIQTNN